MSYSDWMKSIMYVERRCKQESERTGRDIRYKEYTMYNGRKGVYIQLICNGSVFNEWASGIHSNYMDFKDCCEIMIQRACIA